MGTRNTPNLGPACLPTEVVGHPRSGLAVISCAGWHNDKKESLYAPTQNFGYPCVNRTEDLIPSSN